MKTKRITIERPLPGLFMERYMFKYLVDSFHMGHSSYLKEEMMYLQAEFPPVLRFD